MSASYLMLMLTLTARMKKRMKRTPAKVIEERDGPMRQKPAEVESVEVLEVSLMKAVVVVVVVFVPTDDPRRTTAFVPDNCYSSWANFHLSHDALLLLLYLSMMKIFH